MAADDDMALIAAGTLPRLRSVGASPRAVDGLRQLGLGLLVWAGYLLITHSAKVDLASAAGRGRTLLVWERWLRLDVELAANRWLAHQPVLGWLAAWEYATTYIVTTFAVLGWMWWRRQADYRWARNVLLASTVIALMCFWLFPTTPPRLLDHRYFDIVAAHHPVLSWGGGTVASTADQYAAMPSLHIGWAVWVSVVALRWAGSRLGYLLAFLHLLVTAVVVVATANHYLVDVAAGGVLVWLAVRLERLRSAWLARSRAPDRGQRMRPEDEFFLHVETATVQQPVGGFALLELADGKAPDLAAVRALVRQRIEFMPRFQQQMRQPTWWRHARWCPVEVDIDEHVREHVLPGAGGYQALAEFVARLAEQQLDRSRAPWQLWFVPNVGPGEAATVAILHHCVGDGLGVVDIMRALFEPLLPPPDLSDVSAPSPLQRAALPVLGIAQLATDGRIAALPFTAPLSGTRVFCFASTALQPVRELARRTGARVTDVLLSATGTALAELECRDSVGSKLRAAVPITTRLPAPPGTGRRAEPGNLTSALRLDVPLAPMSPLQRLADVRAAAQLRRRSARPFGSSAVVRLLGLLPPVLHRPAARAMYSGQHFTAIVSNMPGPSVRLALAGAPVNDVYPIISLAEQVPLGVGALGWAGRYCVSVTADAQRLPMAPTLAGRIVEVIERMQLEAGLLVAAEDGQVRQ
ncbi:MAG TPA: phosphatase PAP2 family protein [Jatrophihabitans sp.]|nr:phosphatase PAP2 family protein [Jatrophihabitans sp.]